MIYDCCMLYNELDMLELRFNVLDGVVDRFVVVEAAETHSGKPKPLHLYNNFRRFGKFADKLIYVYLPELIVDEHKPMAPAWQRERYQRSQIARGLIGARHDDLVIVGDCDEIPNPDALRIIKGDGAKLEMDFYYYTVNHKVRQGWAIGAMRWGLEKNPNKIRTCEGHDDLPRVWGGGWHFSYMGTPAQIIDKIQAFMHADFAERDPRLLDPAYIEAAISQHANLFTGGPQIDVVGVAETLPRYLLDNLDKYPQWVSRGNNGQAARHS